MIAIFPEKIEYILCPWLKDMPDPGKFKIDVTLPSGVLLGIPSPAPDGAKVYIHDFSDNDMACLRELEGSVAEKIPENWEFVEDRYKIIEKDKG